MTKLRYYFLKFITFLKNPWTWEKVLVTVGSLTGLVVIISIFFFLFIWLGLTGHIPGKEELKEIENPMASEVYSADSVLLGRYFIQERSDLRFDQIPKAVVDALLATEDVRFYEHSGVDKRSLGRVIVKSLLMQSDASGGGSTLTQQLAKNLYPRKSHAVASLLTNKIREIIIASRFESIYSKNEILTLYLNTVPFGDNTFGLESAAQRFFSVRAQDLTVDQAAVLIGMLKATHSYNPRINPTQSLTRRNVVISQMEKYAMLTPQQADSFKTLPIELKYNNVDHNSGLAPYFRDFIRPELLAWCEKYSKDNDKPVQLYTGGLKIYTTIDSRMQRYAEEAMTHQMQNVQKNFLLQWGKTDPWYQSPGFAEAAWRKSDHYRALKQQGASDEEIKKVMNTKTSMMILTPEGEREATFSPLDSIRHYLKFLNAGFLAMDPQTGAVKVWVGGINHKFFQFDHVKESTKRQVGSTFKPIVYTAALEQGARACDFISAEKITYTNMEDWAPENSEDNYGLKYSMPGALAYSVNTVSVRILEKAGISKTIALARRMGIKSQLEAVPSLALGSANISMIEMVSAYSGFANKGRIVKPSWITSIVSHQDKVLERFTPASPTQAVSAESADMMLHMLRRAVNEGTSSSLRTRFGLPNDIAGKTGTTQSNADGWFIAVTPKLIVGSWVGADAPQIRFRTTALGQGARTALPIVGEFFQRSNKDPKLNAVTRARFPELAPKFEKLIACDLSKTDRNIFKRIFGKKDKKREFGKPKKKGLMEKLFGKKS